MKTHGLFFWWKRYRYLRLSAKYHKLQRKLNAAKTAYEKELKKHGC